MILDVDGQSNVSNHVKLAMVVVGIEGLVALVIAFRLCGCLSSP